jgi:hypothetical protein
MAAAVQIEAAVSTIKAAIIDNSEDKKNVKFPRFIPL